MEAAGAILDRESQQLRELLTQLNLSPPYILVGHKLGSVFAQGFANENPDSIVGVVYLDPTAPPANLNQVALAFEEAGENVVEFGEKIPSSQIVFRSSDDLEETKFLERLVQEERFSWEDMAKQAVPSVLMLSRRNDVVFTLSSVSEEDKLLAKSIIESRNTYFQDLTTGIAHFSLVLSSTSYGHLPRQATTSVALSIQEVIYAESGRRIVSAARQLSVSDFEKFVSGLRSYLPGFLLSERELNMLGYGLMREDKFNHALVLVADNLKNHPNSANVYDSYGDGLLGLNRVEEAAKYFERAVELGKIGNHRDLGLFVKNLERTEEILKK